MLETIFPFILMKSNKCLKIKYEIEIVRKNLNVKLDLTFYVYSIEIRYNHEVKRHRNGDKVFYFIFFIVRNAS
jgi:hypothetical protein